MFHAFGSRGGLCAWDLSVQVLVCRSQCAYSRREYTSSARLRANRPETRLPTFTLSANAPRKIWVELKEAAHSATRATIRVASSQTSPNFHRKSRKLDTIFGFMSEYLPNCTFTIRIDQQAVPQHREVGTQLISWTTKNTHYEAHPSSTIQYYLQSSIWSGCLVFNTSPRMWCLHFIHITLCI